MVSYNAPSASASEGEEIDVSWVGGWPLELPRTRSIRFPVGISAGEALSDWVIVVPSLGDSVDSAATNWGRSQRMFRAVDSKINFPEQERAIQVFWSENDIPQKALDQRRNCPTFVFFEGPPTANGLPHPGHCLTRVIKDVFPRYFTMRGYYCERKAGWDTHGLPVEIEVGKQLGLVGKQDIERYGVEPFIHQCIDSVFRYTKEWEELTRRLAFWVNLDEAYVTYHQSFVESVWWALKVLFDKGLLYQGHKVVWWWPQGGTALSSGEVGEGYRDTDDPSITIRFRVDDSSVKRLTSESGQVSLLAWTTTPWTLSSNVALAVGADFDYALVEYRSGSERELFVLAEPLIEKTFAGLKIKPEELTIQKRFKGSELKGLKYQPMFNDMAPSAGRHHEVDVADFVTLDQGTGVVHVAPAFGEDDYRFARDKGFGFLQMVLPDGTFRPEATDVAGRFCKEADKDIIAILKSRGILLKRDTLRHPYPFCPRAEDDPLIQYARQSWFIKTTAFKEEFLANNQEVNWLPPHIREGRFGDFLRNNVDWAISRERYWGTPLPIWQCEETGYQEAIGSLSELAAKTGVSGWEAWENAKRGNPALSDHLAVHKPYIDAVTYQSPKSASARMRRVPEVIDCWFDSGCMPFAQWGYPHQGKEKFRQQYPADFISEAIDQTRGWFYSLLSIATMLKDDLGKPSTSYPLPFKRCIVLGHLVGEDGKKMSKRLKNYREPTYIFDTYGADALRWFFLSGQAPWTSARFEEGAIQERQREFLLRLHNVYGFFVIYANIDGFDPSSTPRPRDEDLSLLDRWIRSELEKTTLEMTERMNALDSMGAAEKLNAFVDGLSNWHVRLSRERFWAAGMAPDKRAAHWTLYDCLLRLSKLIAPFVPFFAESLYQNLARRHRSDALESVHLCSWPDADESVMDPELSAEMELVREIVSVGRSARTQARLKVRQPLAKVEILLADHRLDPVVERHRSLIMEELNVKGVERVERAEDYVLISATPNPKSLGKRLGKRLALLGQWMKGQDPIALRQSLVETGRIEAPLEGETVSLSAEDVQITLSAKPGFAAAEGKGVVVVISVEVTESLRQEGLVRELIHAIQGIRRQLDLPFDARIRLFVGAHGAMADAIKTHGDTLRHETLATERADQPLGAGAHREELILDGHAVVIEVARHAG